MSALQEQYVVDTEGNKTAVILSFERYEQLLEDLHDLAIVTERREEEHISFEEMKRRLQRDGLLLHQLQTVCREILTTSVQGARFSCDEAR